MVVKAAAGILGLVLLLAGSGHRTPAAMRSDCATPPGTMLAWSCGAGFGAAVGCIAGLGVMSFPCALIGGLACGYAATGALDAMTGAEPCRDVGTSFEMGREDGTVVIRRGTQQDAGPSTAGAGTEDDAGSPGPTADGGPWQLDAGDAGQ